jgi:hypothetical protein
MSFKKGNQAPETKDQAMVMQITAIAASPKVKSRGMTSLFS